MIAPGDGCGSSPRPRGPLQRRRKHATKMQKSKRSKQRTAPSTKADHLNAGTISSNGDVSNVGSRSSRRRLRRKNNRGQLRSSSRGKSSTSISGRFRVKSSETRSTIRRHPTDDGPPSFSSTTTADRGGMSPVVTRVHRDAVGDSIVISLDGARHRKLPLSSSTNSSSDSGYEFPEMGFEHRRGGSPPPRGLRRGDDLTGGIRFKDDLHTSTTTTSLLTSATTSKTESTSLFRLLESAPSAAAATTSTNTTTTNSRTTTSMLDESDSSQYHLHHQQQQHQLGSLRAHHASSRACTVDSAPEDDSISTSTTRLHAKNGIASLRHSSKSHRAISHHHDVDDASLKPVSAFSQRRKKLSFSGKTFSTARTTLGSSQSRPKNPFKGIARKGAKSKGRKSIFTPSNPTTNTTTNGGNAAARWAPQPLNGGDDSEDSEASLYSFAKPIHPMRTLFRSEDVLRSLRTSKSPILNSEELSCSSPPHRVRRASSMSSGGSSHADGGPSSIHAAIQLPNTLYDGFLLYKSKDMPSTRRYVVLTSGHLYCFRDASDTGASLSIALDTITRIRYHNITVHVSTPTKKHTFFARSLANMATWKAKLSQAHRDVSLQEGSSSSSSAQADAAGQGEAFSPLHSSIDGNALFKDMSRDELALRQSLALATESNNTSRHHEAPGHLDPLDGRDKVVQQFDPQALGDMKRMMLHLLKNDDDFRAEVRELLGVPSLSASSSAGLPPSSPRRSSAHHSSDRPHRLAIENKHVASWQERIKLPRRVKSLTTMQRSPTKKKMANSRSNPIAGVKMHPTPDDSHTHQPYDGGSRYHQKSRLGGTLSKRDSPHRTSVDDLMAWIDDESSPITPHSPLSLSASEVS